MRPPYPKNADGTFTLAQLEAATIIFRRHPEQWTPDGMAAVERTYGTHGMPLFLWAIHQDKRIPTDLIRPYVIDAWAHAYRAELIMQRHGWIELFDAAGYTVDGALAPRPTEPLILWRGAHPDYARNLTWTADRTDALPYADKPGRRLYWASVAPWRLYGALTGLGEEPAQYVINTDGLKIHQERITDADRELASQRKHVRSLEALARVEAMTAAEWADVIKSIYGDDAPADLDAHAARLAQLSDMQKAELLTGLLDGPSVDYFVPFEK